MWFYRKLVGNLTKIARVDLQALKWLIWSLSHDLVLTHGISRHDTSKRCSLALFQADWLKMLKSVYYKIAIRSKIISICLMFHVPMWT